MTALRKYARLEASGIWRASAKAQRLDVIVSIGDAMLVISDSAGKPLAHWSLAAIAREGAGTPAIFFPDGDVGETLELPKDEPEMIEAIETLRTAVAKARPHPGRLRWIGAVVSVAVVVAVATLWVPGALVNHALRVLPEVNRTAIGDQLLARVTRVSGQACASPGAYRALRELAARTGVRQVVIVPEGVPQSLYLPGSVVLLNRSIVEDYEEPDVAAGYVLAEVVRHGGARTLRNVLETGGVRATAALLTTGDVPPHVLDGFVETQAFAPATPVAHAALLAAFEEARISSTPYAYAEDISGETTLPLIEADPMGGQSQVPIMRDADWLQLQAICDS